MMRPWPHETEIAVTCTCRLDGVFIFETDAVAEIGFDAGGDPLDWEIVAFRFADGARATRVLKVRDATLFNLLRDCLDERDLEWRLIDLEELALPGPERAWARDYRRAAR